MKIYLIRHGESTSDVKQKYDGNYDDPLTDQGLKEAEQVAQKLRDKGIQIIFSSSRIRAKQTAKILEHTCNCKTIITPSLNEQDIYGAYPDLAKNQPEEEYRRLGEVLAMRDNIITGVEPYSQFRDRVINGYYEILNGGYDIVAIVTHGGPIRCIFRDVLKLGEFKKIGNGAIIELEKNDLNVQVINLDNAFLQ